MKINELFSIEAEIYESSLEEAVAMDTVTSKDITVHKNRTQDIYTKKSDNIYELSK